MKQGSQVTRHYYNDIDVSAFSSKQKLEYSKIKSQVKCGRITLDEFHTKVIKLTGKDCILDYSYTKTPQNHQHGVTFKKKVEEFQNARGGTGAPVFSSKN